MSYSEYGACWMCFCNWHSPILSMTSGFIQSVKRNACLHRLDLHSDTYEIGVDGHHHKIKLLNHHLSKRKKKRLELLNTTKQSKGLAHLATPSPLPHPFPSTMKGLLVSMSNSGKVMRRKVEWAYPHVKMTAFLGACLTAHVMMPQQPPLPLLLLLPLLYTTTTATITTTVTSTTTIATLQCLLTLLLLKLLLLLQLLLLLLPL